jgi:hypothetical protein
MSNKMTALQASFQIPVESDSETRPSTDFWGLVRQVAQLKEQIHGSEVRTWELRVVLGEKLLEAQSHVKGQWLKFLRVVDISQPVAWRYMNLAKQVRKLKAKAPNFSLAKAVENYSLANNFEELFNAAVFHGHRRKHQDLSPEEQKMRKVLRWWDDFGDAKTKLWTWCEELDEVLDYFYSEPSKREMVIHELWLLIQWLKQALGKLTAIDGHYSLEAGYRELYTEFPHYLYEKHLCFLDTGLGEGEDDFWRLVKVAKGDVEVPAYINLNGVALNTTEYSERLVNSIVSQSLNGGHVGNNLAKTKAFLDLIAQQTEDLTLVNREVSSGKRIMLDDETLSTPKPGRAKGRNHE